MSFLKDIKQIKENVNAVTEKFDELTAETIRKAKKYDELKDYLSKVKFSVDKITLVLDKKDFVYGVKVEYNIPPITLFVDSDGGQVTNERFKAINMLDLISFDDMAKIKQKINEAINKNKEVE